MVSNGGLKYVHEKVSSSHTHVKLLNKAFSFLVEGADYNYGKLLLHMTTFTKVPQHIKI